MFQRMSKTMIVVLLAAMLLVACSSAGSQDPSKTEPTNASGIANPASENCIKQGGTEKTMTRSDGSQYGICIFQENMQCEEWALFRGECPVGGVDISSYVTEASKFCAISGGLYTVTANSAQSDEQGSCKLPNGNTCDAAAYFEGKCQ